MVEPSPELKAEVERLSRELSALSRRVAALELEGGAPAQVAAPAAEAIAEIPARAEAPFVPLVGRTLMVLGGAYLLRALSDSGTLPGRAGAIVGLAYAIAWLAAADRAAAGSARRSAVFHGLAAVLVGFPLLLETAARFETLPVSVAALGLVGFHAGACLVAVRRSLEPVAWIATLAAAVAAPALLIGTKALLPAVFTALGSAALIEVVSARTGWGGLRWPIAAAANTVVLALAWLLARTQGLPEGYAPLAPTTGVAVALLLPLLYLVSIATRTLIFQRRVSGFAMVQSGAALLVGVGGAEWVLATRGARPLGLYLALVPLGVLAYALGFTWVDRHAGRGRNYYFYSILGLVQVLTGTGGVLSGGALSALWLALAITLAVLGLRYDRDTLRVQAVVCWLGAALVASLHGVAVDGLLAPADRAWREAGAVGAVVALAGPACYALLFAARPESPRWPELVPRALLAASAAVVLAGLVAGLLEGALAGASSGAADPGLTATVRTAVLAAVAVGLALGHRRWRAPELRWLVTPTLVLGGLKLLLEDLPRGRPATLFLSLAAYGGALVLVPRLLRRD